MSTKKETKKTATPKSEEAKAGTCKAFVTDKDGNTHEATAEEMAAAKGAFITVAQKTDDGVEVAATFDCRIRHYDNGNIGLFVRAANGLNNAEVDNPQPHDVGFGCRNDKLTLLGRGNALDAAFALVECYKAYATNFGQADAYRMVKMVLDKGESKSWFGLFVPAMSVVTM